MLTLLCNIVYRDNENERERERERRVPSRHFFCGPAYRDLFCDIYMRGRSNDPSFLGYSRVCSPSTDRDTGLQV